MVQRSDVSKSVPEVKGPLIEGTSVHKDNKSTVDTHKIEKEEGELSPNGDFEEDSFAAYGGSNLSPNAKKSVEAEHNQPGTFKDISCHDNGGENDADDEVSENVPEAGDDVSGSESAADECSHEEREEEDEEQEEDGKAESECEAEVLDNVLAGDGLSLPPSERFLLTTKPLAKHDASTFHDNEKNSCVFYGNDAYYVLFRLHQVRINSISSFTDKDNVYEILN